MALFWRHNARGQKYMVMTDDKTKDTLYEGMPGPYFAGDPPEPFEAALERHERNRAKDENA